MMEAATIRMMLNGASRTVVVPPMKRLLDVLRQDCALTGTKEGCGEGECGSCSVLMNGELVNSCLVPALQADGATICTIEGMAAPDTTLRMHVIQESFLRCGGAQCGICTPGMILATHHLLARCPQPSLEEIQEGLAGNLCRCTGYMRIFEAVQEAASEVRSKSSDTVRDSAGAAEERAR
jgi:carbon-monoxide dehydrogenase small subunit